MTTERCEPTASDYPVKLYGAFLALIEKAFQFGSDKDCATPPFSPLHRLLVESPTIREAISKITSPCKYEQLINEINCQRIITPWGELFVTNNPEDEVRLDSAWVIRESCCTDKFATLQHLLQKEV